MKKNIAHNVKALLSGFEFEKQKYMTKEQLSNMAAEAYNRLGKNPPSIHWMDGYAAGYIECQQNLQQCSVSGSLPLAEIFDMLNKAHEELAKCSLSQDEYSPISWALVDAKKRLSVLLRQ